MEDKMIKPSTLEIDDDYVSNGIGGRPIYFQCTMRDPITVLDHGLQRTEHLRCGGDSIAVISYLSPTGNEITHHVCDRHLKKTMDGAYFLSWETVDKRRKP